MMSQQHIKKPISKTVRSKDENNSHSSLEYSIINTPIATLSSSNSEYCEYNFPSGALGLVTQKEIENIFLYNPCGKDVGLKEEKDIQRCIIRNNALMAAKKLAATLFTSQTLEVDNELTVLSVLKIVFNKMTFDIIDTFGGFEYKGNSFQPRYSTVWLSHLLNIYMADDFLIDEMCNTGNIFGIHNGFLINVQNRFVLGETLDLLSKQICEKLSKYHITIPRGDKLPILFKIPENITAELLEEFIKSGYEVPQDVISIVYNFEQCQVLYKRGSIDCLKYEPYLKMFNIKPLSISLSEMISKCSDIQNYVVDIYTPSYPNIHKFSEKESQFSSKGDPWQLVSGESINMLSCPFFVDQNSQALATVFSHSDADIMLNQKSFKAKREPNLASTKVLNMYS